MLINVISAFWEEDRCMLLLLNNLCAKKAESRQVQGTVTQITLKLIF